MTVVSYTTFSDSTFISFFFPPKTHFSFPHLFQTLNPSPPDSDGRLFFSPVISCSLIYGSLSTFISGSSSFFYPLAYSPLDQTVFFRSSLAFAFSNIFGLAFAVQACFGLSISTPGCVVDRHLQLVVVLLSGCVFTVRVSPSPLSNISVLQYSR